MKIQDIKKLWDNWLANNYDAFIYKPYIVEYEQYTDFPKIIIQFEGISHLCCMFNDDMEAEVFVYECQQYWDVVFWTWIDGPKITNDGKYYCSGINDDLQYEGKPPRFFESEQAMWNDFVFDELLSWCLRKLTPDNLIACYGKPEAGDYWGSRIISKEQVKQEYGCIKCNESVIIMPVVNPYY